MKVLPLLLLEKVGTMGDDNVDYMYDDGSSEGLYSALAVGAGKLPSNTEITDKMLTLFTYPPFFDIWDLPGLLQSYL
jgi:hypothetical protein